MIGADVYAVPFGDHRALIGLFDAWSVDVMSVEVGEGYVPPCFLPFFVIDLAPRSIVKGTVVMTSPPNSLSRDALG